MSTPHAPEGDVEPDRVRGDPPAVVLTFTGGGGRGYHRAVLDDGLRADCGQRGRNATLKQRELIESHYTPCGRCFPDGVGT